MNDIERMLEDLRSDRTVDVEYGTVDAVQEMSQLKNVLIPIITFRYNIIVKL